MKLCSTPKCPNVQPCARHPRQVRHRDPFYLSAPWRDHRARYLRAHPVCELCAERSAVIVDHKQRRPRGAPFDPLGHDAFSNLHALCRSCDGTKSARYDGHFGNPLKPYPSLDAVSRVVVEPGRVVLGQTARPTLERGHHA